MTNDPIIINHNGYSLSAPPINLPPFETAILTFCRHWLAGQKTFTLHTSGSTGAPKPITLRREHLIAGAKATGAALALQPGDKTLVCLPVEYIAGLMMLVRGLVLGLPLTVITPGGNPLANFAPETRFAFTALTPMQLHTALTQSPEKTPILNGMKAILLGGAPVGDHLRRQIEQLEAPVYHTYGMTETASHIALRRLNGPHPSEFFMPLPGVLTGLDERGCLTITAPVTGGQPLVTNDRVEWRPDGAFIWLGRVDHVINSGGVKVQIETVEAALEEALGGRRCLVCPQADDRLGQIVTTVIEGDPLSPAEETALKTALGQKLTRFEIPRRFAYQPRLPQTATGKIDRQAISSRLSAVSGQRLAIRKS